MSSSNNANNAKTTTPPKKSTPLPLPIPFTPRAGGRDRSASIASVTSTSSSDAPALSASPSSPPTAPLRTPFPTSPTSPTLSYLIKSPTTSSYFKHAGSALADEDAETTDAFAGAALARRMSNSWAGGRYAGQMGSPMGTEQQERGKGIMRRLSLGQAFAPKPIFSNLPAQTPAPPPALAPVRPSAIPAATEPVPTLAPAPRTKGLAPPRTPKKRAVSPMGERILKGHFDGFV